MKSTINKFKKASPLTSKGYTLLLAVIVSVMVLSIAAFILSVSRKQEILSASARDSMYSFYSADSALECALENLDNLKTQTPTSISCGANNSSNSNQIAVSSIGNTATAGTSTFSFLTGTGDFSLSNNQGTQSGAASCASTSVSYFVDTTTGATTTIVIASGYNIGWNTHNNDCSITGPRKVERVLQYTQY